LDLNHPRTLFRPTPPAGQNAHLALPDFPWQNLTLEVVTSASAKKGGKILMTKQHSFAENRPR